MQERYRETSSKRFIQAARLGHFTFERLTDPGDSERVRAAVDALVASANFTSVAFSDSVVYKNWETQHVIGTELWRNLGLAIACVAAVSLLMLADAALCALVLTCVVFTLVNLAHELFRTYYSVSLPILFRLT